MSAFATSAQYRDVRWWSWTAGPPCTRRLGGGCVAGGADGGQAAAPGLVGFCVGAVSFLGAVAISGSTAVMGVPGRVRAVAPPTCS